MRRFFANRDRNRLGATFEPRYGGDTLHATDVRKRKLAFTTLFIFLLIITVSHKWNGTVGLLEKARREAFLENLEALGKDCIAEQEYLGAILVFETMLKESPESPLADEALCRVGLCWLCLDNSDGAMEAWERFLKLYPDSELAPKVRQSYLIIMKDRLRRQSV